MFINTIYMIMKCVALYQERARYNQNKIIPLWKSTEMTEPKYNLRVFLFCGHLKPFLLSGLINQENENLTWL